MSEHQQLGEQQEVLRRFAVEVAIFDLNAFVEDAAQAGSAPALGSGDDLRFAGTVGELAEIARLLKPFRDEVIRRLDRIMAEGSTGSNHLTPNADPEDTTDPLVGKVVAGQPITSVPAEDEVECECHDPECSCGGKCQRTALYEWGEDWEGDWLYLCRTCCQRIVERGIIPDFPEGETKDT